MLLTVKQKYQDTLDFMFAQLPMYQRQGSVAFKKDLTNISKLCSFLGNPQDKFPSIHVAGTNGKGSVSHMIASILQEYGFKVGLYTSPHYKDFRERIKINGRLIERESVINFINHIRPKLSEIPASFFEMTVAMAFEYFADQKVDIAVVETGLGGRLDSTNIITPMLSVITNISLDHTDMLGDTEVLIAGEKAGIIKHNVPVVIGEANADISKVFNQKASEMTSEITYAEEVGQCSTSNHRIHCKIADHELNFGSDFVSPYFLLNIRTALVAMRSLVAQQLIEWDSEKMKRGLENLKSNTYFLGRWEKLNEKPLTIADSAHNEAGLRIVIRNLEEIPHAQLHIVLGFVKDKDIGNILAFFPKNARYYFVKADIPRGLDAKQLKTKAEGFGLKGRSYVSVQNGYKAARRNATSDDLIYIGGSIFTLAEVL